MAIPVKLQIFEGPLDLLLHLIDKNRIDIYDIPIVEITHQYMDYIRSMEHEDLGIMSEFLVMAATLMDIKCRMLLPRTKEGEEQEEEDPRAELVERLLEYKTCKYLSSLLRDRMEDAAGVFYRQPSLPEEVKSYKPPVDPEELLGGMTLEKLNGIYRTLLRRQEDKLDPIRSSFGKIEQEEVSLSDKMDQMREYASTHRHFGFFQLLGESSQSSRIQVIVTFLSILELMKMGYVHADQEEAGGEIQVDVLTDPAGWEHLTDEKKEE